MGSDVANGLEGQFYATSIPVGIAMNKKSDILLAYEMNGEPLSRDHGYPLRVICPGMIGSKSVKWLQRIMVIQCESPNQY